MSNLPVEPEFQQAYNELASTLENSTLFQKYPEYRKALQVVSIPERIIQFRVVWEDDNGQLQVNRGYRVQFNSALGPYKGGLRFHPSVNLSILKFLGFEQTFKNALTGLNMGGAKGGADFDPKGKSDNEIRRFCVSFMSELCKHIGADTDVPAGDIGVSGREIGYLFGQYKKIRNRWEGVLTGKGTNWGGSLYRPEATGYGVVYYVQHMIQYATSEQGTLKGKRIAISGSGNVAQYAALKAIELGASVISMSDSQGSLIVTGSSEGDSFTPEEIHHIAKLKEDRKQISSLFDTTTTNNTSTDAISPFNRNKHKFKYIPNARPWTNLGDEKVDIALPCATQNEISGSEALALLASGCQYIAEGSNMGCTQEAIDIFENARESSLQRENKGQGQGEGEGIVWYAPGKAANAGGVAVSGLEMAQNSTRLSWSAEEVDERLKEIMRGCFEEGVRMALEYTTTPATTTHTDTHTSASLPDEKDGKETVLPSLVAGSNIAGFIKVAVAMREHGDWW